MKYLLYIGLFIFLTSFFYIYIGFQPDDIKEKIDKDVSSLLVSNKPKKEKVEDTNIKTNIEIMRLTKKYSSLNKMFQTYSNPSIKIMRINYLLISLVFLLLLPIIVMLISNIRKTNKILLNKKSSEFPPEIYQQILMLCLKNSHDTENAINKCEKINYSVDSLLLDFEEEKNIEKEKYNIRTLTKEIECIPESLIIYFIKNNILSPESERLLVKERPKNRDIGE